VVVCDHSCPLRTWVGANSRLARGEMGLKAAILPGVGGNVRQWVKARRFVGQTISPVEAGAAANVSVAHRSEAEREH
jgi:hypothetical protein